MRNDNAELIQRILEGDDAAFADLVRKYQKRVHALAWRKIGDFHIAEDITQEAFLQVYRKLATLKDPSQFRGGFMSSPTAAALRGSARNRSRHSN